MKRKKRVVAMLTLGLQISLAAQTGDWIVVQQGQLCVTEGTIEVAAKGKMSVGAPKMRAYLAEPSAQAVEMRFLYLGATSGESPLASGEMRRQLGLKLRSQDPCNLVYVMWRIEPENELVVSVKRNPKDHTSTACGTRGYKNIKPAHKDSLPGLQPGETHTLRAEMADDILRVFADHREVWTGNLRLDAHGLVGPVGIRTDNVHLEFDLKAGAAGKDDHDARSQPCKAGAESEE
jgi:hypothetical protein